jgi:type I restriction enzyme M protein
MTYLERALKDGHAKITDGKQPKITYIAVNWTERYSDPEEQVRAEYWAELIYRYGYEPARIGMEVVVPNRTPSDARASGDGMGRGKGEIRGKVVRRGE